jgi:hypothetical protein
VSYADEEGREQSELSTRVDESRIELSKRSTSAAANVDLEVRRAFRPQLCRKPLSGMPAIDALPPIACHGGTRDSCSGFGVC